MQSSLSIQLDALRLRRPVAVIYRFQIDSREREFITGGMKHIAFVCCLVVTLTVVKAAEPELKWTVDEVRQHLTAMDRIVTVLGEGEVKSPADRAVVTLRLTSDSRSLQEALKANQGLAQKWSER